MRGDGAVSGGCRTVPLAHGRSELGSLSALFGTGVFVRLVDQYFWRWYFEEKRRTPVPKFIREVTAAVLLLVTCCWCCASAINQNDSAACWPHPAWSGIVLGFALQDSLGNIIAGLALQIGRPFTVGDWLLIDNQHVQAVEINWRSTRFITTDEVQLDVPNQQIVRQTIVNYHGGGSRHAMRFEIGLDYDVPPNRAKDVLARRPRRPMASCPNPRRTSSSRISGTAPSLTKSVTGSTTIVPSDLSPTRFARTSGMRCIATPSASPSRSARCKSNGTALPHATSDGPHERHDAICALLGSQPLFRSMGDEHLKVLVARSPLQHYGRGEAIIREGADGSSMFVLVNGEAGVTVEAAGQATRVATLRNGDCFGEMSLLTGEKRSASVLAVKDCEVLEVTKPVFADIIARDAGLLAPAE